MIDVMSTRLGEVINKVNLLYDSVAWVEANDANLKAKIVREWIQRNQLKGGGIDSTGEIIGFYSLATQFISNGRKQQGDPYDLDDTGSFYSSMFVRVLSDVIIIEADSQKMEDQNWWNEDILNLTDENLQKYIDEIKTNYQKYARRILGLD